MLRVTDICWLPLSFCRLTERQCSLQVLPILLSTPATYDTPGGSHHLATVVHSQFKTTALTAAFKAVRT